MVLDSREDESPLTKSELQEALRRMHEAHSTLRSTEIADKDGVVHRIYDALTYDGLKNSELYEKIGDAGLAGLIESAHAENQARNLDSRFSITTDAEGNILEVQKGYARGFFGNLGRRPTDDDTSYPAVFFHGKWKAGESPAEWNLDNNCLIFWKSRDDDFTYSENDAASFVPNLPSDRVSVTAQDANGQETKVTGMPVRNESGEITQIVGYPIMGAFDALNGYAALSDGAKTSFRKRLEEIGTADDAAVAVYDAAGKINGLLIGRLTRWGDTQMESVIDINTGEITELESPVICNGSSAQQAKDFMDAVAPLLAGAHRAPYLVGAEDAERLIGTVDLKKFKDSEIDKRLPRNNVTLDLYRQIREAEAKGTANAAVATLDVDNRIDRVFLCKSDGLKLAVTHSFDCSTGFKFTAPLAAAALTGGDLGSEERLKLLMALQPQIVGLKADNGMQYIVEPMNRQQFRQSGGFYEMLMRDHPQTREVIENRLKKNADVRFSVLLDSKKIPVAVFIGKADHATGNVELSETLNLLPDAKTKEKDNRPRCFLDRNAVKVPHGRLSPKTAVVLAKKSKLLAQAEEILPEAMRNALAQVMDRNYQPESKAAAGETVQVAMIPSLPGGARRM